MILIRFDAVPDTDKLRLRYAGAAINCWINVDEPSEAERVARDGLKNSGWRLTKVDNVERLDREQQADSGLQYFDEAVADGASFVIHTWPRISLVEPEE